MDKDLNFFQLPRTRNKHHQIISAFLLQSKWLKVKEGSFSTHSQLNFHIQILCKFLQTWSFSGPSEMNELLFLLKNCRIF